MASPFEMPAALPVTCQVNFTLRFYYPIVSKLLSEYLRFKKFSPPSIMKNIVFLVLSVLAFGSLAAQSTNDKGLYVSSDGELFSGVITKTQGDIRSEFTIEEGIINGAVKYFFPSGKLMESGIYTAGLKDQKW